MGALLCDNFPSVVLNGTFLLQEEKNNVRKLMASFVWTHISKLSFEVSCDGSVVATLHAHNL